MIINSKKDDPQMATHQIIETIVFTIAATLFVPLMSIATLYFFYA